MVIIYSLLSWVLSALSNIEEEYGTLLAPYLPSILNIFVAAFHKFQVCIY
jgi:hypothetical protein